MSLLLRKDLLKKQELQIEKVDLGNDDFVFVREMTAKEKDNHEQSMMKKVKQPNGQMGYETTLENFRSKLAVKTVCDEKGKLLFEPQDADKLGEAVTASRMAKIIEVAQRLNKIDPKEKEDLEKN